MLVEIGNVEAIFRYPVKCMRGERLEVAELGWHGLDGDRRLVRCSMVNLDLDSASPASEVLKAVVHANQNNAGIYGA